MLLQGCYELTKTLIKPSFRNRVIFVPKMQQHVLPSQLWNYRAHRRQQFYQYSCILLLCHKPVVTSYKRQSGNILFCVALKILNLWTPTQWRGQHTQIFKSEFISANSILLHLFKKTSNIWQCCLKFNLDDLMIIANLQSNICHPIF